MKNKFYSKLALGIACLLGIGGAVMVGANASKENSYVEVHADGHVHNDITFSEWTSNNSLPSSGNYYLTKDVTISSTWQPNSGTRLCLNGYGIRMTGTGNVIQVRAAGTLYIYDCNKTTTHKYKIDETGLATVDDSYESDYETFSGGYITGAKGVSTGGGIYLPGGSSKGNTTRLYMYGGTIIGNKTTGNGAAINYTYKKNMNSEIELRNTLIIGNVADGSAGGIFHHANNRSMTLVDTKIYKNVAGSRPAGLVEQAQLRIQGDTYIYENRLKNGASSDISVNHSGQTDTFTITGALSDNAKFGLDDIRRSTIYNYFSYNNGVPNEVFISNTNKLMRKDGNNVVYNNVTSTAYNADYDGQPHSISLALDDDTIDHTIKYGLTEGTYDLDTNPEFTLPCDQTVYYQVSMGLNVHKGSSKVTINALPVDYTAPTAKTDLHYTGENQPLVNAGSATHGTMQYKVDEGEWSTDIPSVTSTGSYTVSYKVVGDAGYENVDPISFQVTLSPNDKSALADKILEKKDYYDSIKDQYPGVAGILDTAIKEAEAVRDDDNKTVQEIADAITALDNAATDIQNDIVKVHEVIEKINAIGEVTLEKEVLITTARTAYDALPDGAKLDVTNYNVLEESEAVLKQIKDQIAADAVKVLINAIGDVEYTDACKEKIDAARTAYDALTVDQKELVTNYQTLLDAEAAYAKLKADHDAADAVKDLINAIGDVEYTDACKEKIDAARTAYDALTEDQKALIDEPTLTILTNDENAYAKLKADHDAADAVKALINAIGKVEYTDACKGKIDAARTAYDALTEDQKELVTNKKVLFDDIELYNTLAHQPTVVDNGVKVEGKDGELIPVNVTVKVEVKTSVQAQEGTTEYNNIQEAVGNNQKIAGVYDIKLVRTVDGVETVIQPSDIKQGMIIIIEITLPDGLSVEGLKVLHIHSENDISFVENYKITGNILSFETDRLSEVAFVVPVPQSGLPVGAIVGIIIGGLILLCCLFFLIMFLFFPVYYVDYTKREVRRAIKIKKHFDMVLMLNTHFKFVRRNEVDVYKTAEEAKAVLA